LHAHAFTSFLVQHNAVAIVIGSRNLAFINNAQSIVLIIF